MATITPAAPKISVLEVVRILRSNGYMVTASTVYRWCRKGELKKAKKIFGQWFIDKEEVEQMVRG